MKTCLFGGAVFVAFFCCAQAGKGESPQINPTGKETLAFTAQMDPRTEAVQRFINKYFRTWSNQEMDAYAEGFLSEAVVQHIDGQGTVRSQGAKEFLADQRRYQAVRPAKEAPLSMDIRFEEKLVRAVVYWRLDDGSSRPRFGYDHFTLQERNGQYRIVNLVFYETPEAK